MAWLVMDETSPHLLGKRPYAKTQRSDACAEAKLKHGNAIIISVPHPNFLPAPMVVR